MAVKKKAKIPNRGFPRVCAGKVCARTEVLENELRALQQRIKQLEKDQLTGLPNRYAMEEALANLIAEIKDKPFIPSRNHRKEPQYLCLLLIDLDHFKKINDRRGHKTGDEVLRTVAKELRQVVRKEDLMSQGRPARYGGEELVISFRCIDEESAFKVAEKLRKALAAISHKTAGLKEEFNATASIGIAALHNSFVRKFGQRKVRTELFTLADYSLYASKANGRNMSCYTDVEGNLSIGAYSTTRWKPCLASKLEHK